MAVQSRGRRARNRIKILREAKAWSMDRLGAEISPPTTGSVINRLEKGRMGLTFDWAYRIALALGCDPSQLLENPPPLLSTDERAVVTLYRELGEPDQRAAFRVIDAMAKSEPGADSNRRSNSE
jgi:transcriptional regulator with XRE-family HTH domain